MTQFLLPELSVASPLHQVICEDLQVGESLGPFMVGGPLNVNSLRLIMSDYLLKTTQVRPARI